MPGTGEAPSAPVFVDGEKKVTLKGENIATEFVALIEDVQVADEVARIAGRVREALAQPVQVSGESLPVSASVGVAIPRDRNTFGYLSEHHAYGQTAKTAGDYAEDLAAEMLATILGVEFNANAAWDEKREIWKIADVIYKTKEVTQTAVDNKDGLWTTVVAAAVLLP